MHRLISELKALPEYFIAAKASLAVLGSSLPIYLGLRYFLWRRGYRFPLQLHIPYFGVFGLFAGLAFLYASPLANLLPEAAVRAYLFVTCALAAYGIVALLDVFFIEHYLVHVRKIYISPPLRKIIDLGIFSIAFLPILRFVLQFNPLTLVAIPSILTAGIAFAMQDTLKTFIAGIGLGGMIRIGEWIAVGGQQGEVVQINWGRTVLRTVGGSYVFIPNNLLLTQVFTNFSTQNPANMMSLKVGVSYDAPPERVKQVLLDCVQNVAGVSTATPPSVQLTDFADSSIVYTLFYWLTDFNRQMQVHDELASRIWHALRREGIEIPYPIRALKIQQGDLNRVQG